MKVLNLKTEYKTNPLGIDVMALRLSWEITAEERDVKQIAYRLTTASSLKKLKDETDLLWESGKQDSDQSIHIEYKGKTPESRQSYGRVNDMHRCVLNPATIATSLRSMKLFMFNL